MGKFKMPTVQEFLENRSMNTAKSEPVWIYLEREMRQGAPAKPYNEVVGDWLKFLKDFKSYQRDEHVRQLNQVKKEIGPPWYYELSLAQVDILKNMKQYIHQDLIEGIPKRTTKALRQFGLTIKIPKDTIIKAMKSSYEDSGIFIWNLYTEVFKLSPSENRKEYDMNSGLLMSALVAIDLDETIKLLTELTKPKKAGTQKDPEVGKVKKKKPIPKKTEADDPTKTIYFSKNKVLKPPPPKPKPSGIDPFDYKFKLRSEESLERICEDKSFLAKRIERNIKEQMPERVCTFKFWEPPIRSDNPAEQEYARKLLMLKKRAKAKHKTPENNLQFAVGGITFSRGRPVYVLNSVSYVPTGYIPINAGLTKVNDNFITQIAGYWEFPKLSPEKCAETCKCLEKYEKKVKEYVQNTKCKCGHRYDFYHTEKPTEKYIHPPTRNSPLWIDRAKIYSMYPMEDFILSAVQDALRSEDEFSGPSEANISISGTPPKVLLGVLLADLGDTALILPHLPRANELNRLIEWVRVRTRGKKMSEKQLKREQTQIKRRWDRLERVKFTALAALIPFTSDQLHHMTWKYKENIDTLAKILLKEFKTRNQEKQIEQARLLFPTMRNYNKSFLEIFFTYFPSRMNDTYLLGLFDPSIIPDRPGKTCALEF